MLHTEQQKSSSYEQDNHLVNQRLIQKIRLVEIQFLINHRLLFFLIFNLHDKKLLSSKKQIKKNINAKAIFAILELRPKDTMVLNIVAIIVNNTFLLSSVILKFSNFIYNDFIIIEAIFINTVF